MVNSALHVSLKSKIVYQFYCFCKTTEMKLFPMKLTP
jgi:hypothetical protein